MVAPIVTASLVSAGSSLLGGLLGKKKKTEQQTTRINFQQLRDDALAAGYNPLTALRATGGAGNVTTTSELPSLTSREVLAQALTGGAQTFASLYDPIGDETRRLQNDLLRAEIAEYAKKPSFLSGVSSTRSPMVTQQAVADQPDEYEGKHYGPFQPEPWSFPATLSTGEVVGVPPSFARDMRMSPGQILTGAHYEELVGDGVFNAAAFGLEGPRFLDKLGVGGRVRRELTPEVKPVERAKPGEKPKPWFSIGPKGGEPWLEIQDSWF